MKISCGKENLELSTEYLLNHCYLSEGDSVFVAGSLIEGIGNIYSDIDVYVLTDRLKTSREIDLEKHHRVLDANRNIVRSGNEGQEVFLIHSVVPNTKIKIDVEFKTYGEVNKLIEKVDEIYAYASDNLVLLTKYLAVRENMFLNRLFNNITLIGEQSIEEIRTKIGFGRYAYLCYRWLASDFSVLLDLLGALEKGELIRAIDIARTNAISQMMAVLHLAGFINTNPKWIISYLEKSNLPPSTKNSFIDLYVFNDIGSDRKKIDYIEASLDFVDELHEISSGLLKGNSILPSGDRAIELLKRRFDGGSDRDEFSRWEYAYRAKAYGLTGRPTKELLLKGALP